MIIKLDVPDSQKYHLNMFALKELFQKYGYRDGKRIKPGWVEGLMHEIDPYKFFLEWNVPEISIPVVIDIIKLLKASPQIPELPLIFPNNIKFTIKQGDKAVAVYEKLKEEL